MARTLVSVTLGLAMAVCLGACFLKTPFERGKALGAKHADLLLKDAITFEAITLQVDQAQSALDEPADRDKFQEGYREGVRPARARLTALAMEAAGREAGDALGDLLGGVGEGLGRAVNGFVRGFTGEQGDTPARPEERARQPQGSDDARDATEDMKAVGRDLGKLMKSVGESVEAIADGIEEGLDSEGRTE